MLALCSSSKLAMLAMLATQTVEASASVLVVSTAFDIVPI